MSLESQQDEDPPEASAMKIKTPRPNTLQIKLYYCTCISNGQRCNSCFSRKTDWERHEREQYWLPFNYMCLECNTPVVADSSTPSCPFCLEQFSIAISITTHTLQCSAAQHIGRMFVRLENFCDRLRRKHSINQTAELNICVSTWTFQVENNWPRQCGFCGLYFRTWDERVNHVAEHFQNGSIISTWQLPFHKRKRKVAMISWE